jgi:cytochrome P450
MTTTESLTLDASDPRFYEEPNRPAFLQIHAEHPIYRVDAEYSDPFWNVCSHELIKEVGQDTDLYSSEDGVHLVNSAFATSGQEELVNALRPAIITPTEEHRRLRSPINPYFRHKAIGRMEDQVRDVITGLLDEIEPDTEVEFMEAFGTWVPIRVLAQLFGVGTEREKDFAEWGDAVLISFEPGNEPNLAALGELAQYFHGEMEARNQDPREDLISMMLATDLPEQEVLMWCCILLAAGIETTGNLIGAGLDLLNRHPDQKERLLEDPSLIPAALAEMLRVVTPGRYIRRTATADVELGGQAIKEGDMLAMNFTAANFDPEMFPDPLRFDIDRNPSDTLAFSYGPHRCIGRFLALLEGRVAFEELLARFPATEVRGPLRYRPSTATSVIESMPVVFRAG